MNRRELLEGLFAALAATRATAFGLRPGKPRLGAFSGSGGTGFYADPFSSYTSYIADQTFSGTNGTIGTRSWNGSTITGPLYGPDANGTFQPAINAAAAVNGGASQRVCLLAGQTWTIPNSDGHQFPALTLTTSTSRFVIQGDPAASPSTMPFVNGGGTTLRGYGHAAFWVGGYYNGSNGITGVSNPHITIRKVGVTNFIDNNGVFGLVLYDTGSWADLVVEYCDIYGFQSTGSAGESGPIVVANPGDTTAGEIRYNKLGVVTLVGATGLNQNHSCVGLYGGELYIHHNEMYGSYNGVRIKAPPAAVPNNVRVERNYIHDLAVGLSTASGGEGAAPNGYTAIGNLFGWENLNNSLYKSEGAAPFSDDGVQASNPSTAGGNMTFDHNTVSADWTGNAAAVLNEKSQNQIITNNIILAASPIYTSIDDEGGSFGQCDYNAYFAGSWYRNHGGTTTRVESSWSGWQSTFTNYPSIGDLSANPDAHGMYIPNLTPATIAGQFPGYASNNYAPVSGSLLLTSDSSGGAMGYDPTDYGPGW